MKVQILKSCQPKSKPYVKGEVLDLPAEEALFLMGAGLAVRVEKKRKVKVVTPETLKDDKES